MKNLEKVINTQAKEVTSLLSKTTTTETNLNKSALVLLSSVLTAYVALENFDNWYPDYQGTKIVNEGMSNILTSPLIALSPIANAKKHVVGKMDTNKFSVYTRSILSDMGYAIKASPTALQKKLKGVDFSTLKLSDYLRLLQSIAKLGAMQNKELSELEYTWDNITVEATKTTKIFGLVKSEDVVESEKALADNQKSSLNAPKVLKSMLKSHDVRKDTKENYEEDLSVLFEATKVALLEAYDESIKNAEDYNAAIEDYTATEDSATDATEDSATDATESAAA